MRERLRSSSGLASAASFHLPWKDESMRASLTCEPGATCSCFVKFIVVFPQNPHLPGKTRALARQAAVACGNDAMKRKLQEVEHHHPDQAIDPDRDNRRWRDRANADAQYADGDGDDLRRHNGP